MKTRLPFILTAFLSIFTACNQDFAQQQLNESPRHHEWVEVQSGDRSVHSFVVYPEKSENAQAVIVIHENRGLTDWVRSFADQLAEAGYLAIAPDLLSGYSESISRTSDFRDEDKARDAIYQLDPEQVTQDLDAVYNYIAGQPASTGEVFVLGFCWGGSQTFRYATHNPELKAAIVFYGTAPQDPDQLANIEIPVYGFYGGNDQRVNSTIPETDAAMKKAGNTYEYEIYPGAGHAYMRRGDDPNGEAENQEAKEKSWQRLKNILARESLKKKS